MNEREEHRACRVDVRLVAAGTFSCFREHVVACAHPGRWSGAATPDRSSLKMCVEP